MQIRVACLFLLIVLSSRFAFTQGTVPTFKRTIGEGTYTLAGHDPAKAGTTAIPAVLVPITLTFAGKPSRMDAGPDVPHILESPVFSKFAFSPADKTQYVDAMLRASFPAAGAGHTLLRAPEIKPVTIVIPPGYGYVLTSKKNGGSFAVADSEYVEKELFRQIPHEDGKLVIAFAHNTTYYALSDATVCCTWGTHGIDPASGNSFVLGSYLSGAPAIVEDKDVQPLTQQLAEFFNDPLHNPQSYFRTDSAPGNFFHSWLLPGEDRGCGGAGVGSNYFLLEPTNTNPKNSFPASKPFLARAPGFTYHLQNVALLPWYLGTTAPRDAIYSFPDRQALPEPAKLCQERGARRVEASTPAVAPVPLHGPGNGHKLIGYWTGSRFSSGAPFQLHDVAPQWDIIIAAFASPEKGTPEGTLRFHAPRGIDPDQLKADIAALKKQGRKVMISLGGGGVYFTLDDPTHITNFVSSVTSIVSEYGFDGVDIDFETPSLALVPGDADFKNPTTPSVVNLIAGLRQLREHFGPSFMISLVPEGSQIPGGFPGYGGQFGSYLPLAYGLRDILSFIDVQDYNTPPLEGLDGEIYQSSSVDYHAAMTELLLQGFHVGGKDGQFFPPFPADKVAVGFLTGYSVAKTVHEAMDYLTLGKAPAGASYKLRHPSGYPDLIGAMFWTIDDDRRDNYKYSNLIGPQLHGYPAAKPAK
jgi:chitinase